MPAAVISSGGERFDDVADAVRKRFDGAVATGAPLFRTDAAGLYEAYLGNLPPEYRQHHACSCCRGFIERFGALVTIDAAGIARSALWDADGAPEAYRASVRAMEQAVARARVDGVFLSVEPVWGRPEAGGWTHFFVAPPAALIHRSAMPTAGQAMAAKREDFRTLSRALAEFTRDGVAQALTLLEAEALYRSEKVIGPARFLLGLHDACAAVRGPARDNVTWLAVATAPPGFCTPRGAMVGTLLEDIATGMDFEGVTRRFAAKMHPLQYQRPQAPASAGTIAQAEKLFAAMGLEPALHRRFARLDEVAALWRPEEAVPPKPGGLFAHLAPKRRAAPAPMDMPAQAITWAKFARTVLPTARRMEVFTDQSMNLCGLLTAVHPDAPPLLQWDRPDARNPVSWYVYVNGSTPAQWSLPAGAWVAVEAVTLQPSMWGGEDSCPHQGRSAILVLAGAKDTGNPGLGLFPETIRSELHGVRSVIEAHSRSRQPEGADAQSANGLRVGDTDGAHRIRVTGPTGVACYRIDRWD